MLSPMYADSSVIMERVPPLRKGGRVQPQGHKLRSHPPTSGSSVCANPTYYHTVYDMSDAACHDYSKANGVETVVIDGTLYSLMPSESLVPPIRRRGGLVDHRDVIKAHQSHKLQSTPQARRKQWEWVINNLLHFEMSWVWWRLMMLFWNVLEKKSIIKHPSRVLACLVIWWHLSLMYFCTGSLMSMLVLCI